MMIENGTNDDVIIKVTGGPGGQAKNNPPEKEPKQATKPATRQAVFPLGPGEVWKEEEQKPGSLPAYPWTVQFYTKVSRRDVKSNTAARLRLTKENNNGFKVVRK